MSHKISIVTPNLDTGRFLAATMDSVLAADPGGLEYIVVDGGSRDDSRAIIEARQQRLAHWRSEKDSGLYDAVNKGFELSSGDVMGWLNAGDLYFPDALRVVTEVFTAFPEIKWLTSRVISKLDEPGRLVWQSLNMGYTRASFMGGEHLTGLKPGLSLVTVQQESTFWRRSLWERAGGRLDETLKLAADFELWARLFRHAELCAVSAPLGAFRQHADQLSARHWNAYVAEARAVLGREGGKVKPRLLSDLSVAARLAMPRPLRPLAHRLRVFAPALVCEFDFDRRGWRLGRL